jgi:hypothetical protein
MIFFSILQGKTIRSGLQSYNFLLCFKKSIFDDTALPIKTIYFKLVHASERDKRVDDVQA